MTTYSWMGAKSGDWTTSGMWTPSGPPSGPLADAVIAAAGTYTVGIAAGESVSVDSLVLSASKATFDIRGSLALAGTTGSLAVRAGRLTLENTGTIEGGILAASGGAIHFGGGTLDGVTYRGTLDLSAAAARVVVTGGLTLRNAAGTGPGLLKLTGAGSGLVVTGSTTLDNATIDMASTATLAVADGTLGPATLTLGRKLTVKLGSGSPVLAGSGQDGLVNLGTLNAGTRGGAIGVAGFATFANKGLISVGAGAAFDEQAAAFSNAGTITVASAGTLALGASWSNSGTIRVSYGTLILGAGNAAAWGTIGVISAAHSTVDLYGRFTLAQMKALAVSGGTVCVGGALLDAGGTLTAGSGTALSTLELTGGGTISSGILRDAGGGFVWSGGTLDGVTVRGTLDLSAWGSQVSAVGGITLQGANGTGAGAVNLTGLFSTLDVATGTTLDNAVIDIANGASLAAQGVVGTLTLGAHLTVQLRDGEFYTGAFVSAGGGNALVNLGTIVAGASGNVLALGDAASVTNCGLFSVAAGGSLDLTGTIFTNLSAGTLSGGRYAVSGASTLQLPDNVSIATLGASVALTGAGSTVQSYSTSAKADVALEATLSTIAASGTLQVLGGRSYVTARTVTDNGKILLGASGFTTGGTLAIGKTGTLEGSGVVGGRIANAGLLEARGGTLAVMGPVTGAGELYVASGSALALNEAPLATLAGKVTLSGAGSKLEFGKAGDFLTLESVLTRIDAGGTLAVLGARGYFSVHSITDLGLLDLGGGTISLRGLTLAATGRVIGTGTVTNPVANAGTIEAEGGTLTLAGAVTGAGVLEIANHATLELGAATAPTVRFATGAVGTLKLDAKAHLSGAISGLALGDAITFSGETVSSAAVNSGTLTVTGSGGQAAYRVSGALTGTHVAVQADQHTVMLVAGPAIALAPPSFLPLAAAAHVPATSPVFPLGPDWTGFARPAPAATPEEPKASGGFLVAIHPGTPIPLGHL